jgi:TPR repeat protein
VEAQPLKASRANPSVAAASSRMSLGFHAEAPLAKILLQVVANQGHTENRSSRHAPFRPALLFFGTFAAWALSCGHWSTSTTPAVVLQRSVELQCPANEKAISDMKWKTTGLLFLFAAPALAGCRVSVGSAPASGHGGECGSPTTCEQTCQGGDARSCGLLAKMYDNGDGVQRDEGRATELYRKSCDMGFGPACYVLGMRLRFQGKDNLSITTFRRACDLGHADGCEMAGNGYRGGHYVPKDEQLANDLYKRGCTLGNKSACKRVQ